MKLEPHSNKVVGAVERAVRWFVKPCPLCGEKPRVEMFCRNDGFGWSIPRWNDKCWKLRIACWDNDRDKDVNCMLKTNSEADTFCNAVELAVRLWNDDRIRARVTEQLAGKTYSERMALPHEVAHGMLNGAPRVEEMKGQLRTWICKGGA